MGSLFSPKNTTSTSTYTPPSYITDALKGLVGNAQSTYNQQASQPTTNSLQNTAFGSLANVGNVASPYIGQAADLTTQGTQPYTYSPVGASDISQYESPYNQDVVNATQNQFNLQNAQEQNSLKGNAASAHALGGDRVGVAQAQLAGQQAANQAPTIAGLYNQNYAQALGEANTQQQTGIAAANSNAYRQLYGAGELGSLGQEAQGTALSGAAAQLQGGTLQQQLPYQNLQQFAGLLDPQAGVAGGTGTQQTPGPSLFSQLAGAGLSAAGLGLFGGGGGAAGGGGGYARGGNLRAFDEGGLLDDEDISDDDEYGGEGTIAPTQGGLFNLPSPTPQLQPATAAALAHGNTPSTPTSSQGVAAAVPPVTAPTTPAASNNIFGLDDKHAALLQAGLGILASRAPGTFAPIGEGAQSGLKAYQQSRALQAQQAYRTAMSQAALHRAEAYGTHLANVDAKPQIDAHGDTIKLIHADGSIIDTHYPTAAWRQTEIAGRNADTNAARIPIAQENANTAAEGTLSYIGVQPATQKPIYFNNRTGKQQIGDAPIGPKPSADAGTPGHPKPLTPDVAMAQARHDYDIIFPKPDPASGSARQAPPEGIMNWINKRAKAYQQGATMIPAVPGGNIRTAINSATDADALTIANQTSAALHNIPPKVIPAKPTQYVIGKVYQDASGHKAKWDGQKFVDVP